MLSLVIPAYNEAGNVATVYERLSKIMGASDLDWELIFSVDPSTDGTEALVRELCRQGLAREAAALCPTLRPADGDPGGPGGVLG